jgi:hypothetical protein
MGKFKSYFEVDLPREYKPDERKAIAAEIIDFVISRTEAGKDKDNISFAKYSKAYAKEKGQKNVDLTFSGEMLSEISLLLEKSGKLRIGIDPGSDIVGRVQGNVLGTYGNAEPVTKGRDFLGITQKDLDGILANYPLDDKEEREDRITNLVASELVSRNIISKVKIDVKKYEDDE